ncbi:MAG: hypothetical protein GF388_04470 [Candidatus Aegiribacteria sp.]|nr:hypothetical protein [Candidatus Aegiribacteria sp.]MBD3294490.1 hypothetical protein [Candidatus Fermentibacteria bacterium]
MKSLIMLLLAVSLASGDIESDLLEIGVPVISAEISDSMLVVEMSGTLAQGDSLLKHYGGVFYTALDSIASGWDVCGIAVEIDQATLIFLRRHMIEMLQWISESTDDEAIAEWVLNHTRVIR